jgi:PKD repeat protein
MRPIQRLLLLVSLLPALAPAGAAQAQNLLGNGDFEAVSIAPWEGADSSDFSTAHAHAGARGLHLASAKYVSQGWISVTPGETYALTAWLKWQAFGGEGWGYTVVEVVNDGWQPEGRLDHLDERFEAGSWQSVAVTFVPRTSRVRVGLGVYGPRARVDLAFDDVRLFRRVANAPPTAAPTANRTNGVAPLDVSFSAGAADGDGAVAGVKWEFGDGSASTVANPTHRYLRRGTFTARVTVWDQDGASAAASLTISVTGDDNPRVAIDTPVASGTYTTSASVVTIAGTAEAPAGRSIAGVVWDNVDTDEAAAIPASGARPSWRAEVALKPGRNEILVTATDSAGAAGTSRILVTRTLAGPVIANVEMPCESVRVFETCEVRFDLDTVADHPLYGYDTLPPSGVAPGIGVTAEALISTPSGTLRRQPAFFRHDVTRTRLDGRDHYQTGAGGQWVVRFSPLQSGPHGVVLRVQDASGTAQVAAGTLEAAPAQRAGFIRVSQLDPRYFEFSDGQPFHPIGPAYYPNYASAAGPGLNIDRPWIGGLAIYSTNWSRWMRVDKPMGNEGIDSPLTFLEHYPSHELSRELAVAGAHRIWMGQWLDESFFPRLLPGTSYVLKLRAKVVGLSGPVDPQRPSGLVIKRHGFPTDAIEATLRSAPSLIPAISRDRDWHTLVVRFTPSGADGDLRYLSLLLDNVSLGRAYIDQFSIRPVQADGTLGGEMIRQSRADVHTYVEDRPAAAFDVQVAEAERLGVVLKVVVQDKRDWIYEHLGAAGVFTHRGEGYFQPAGTRAHWLQRQWWRYLAARWGASTAIHSWESCNEADPNDPTVWRHTQAFAQYMHGVDSHPHLATTSFWCCWKPEFWGDSATYPDVDYADLHAYTAEEPVGRDMASWVESLVATTSVSSVGKPVVLAETGIGLAGQTLFEALKQPNPGIWYHNLLWAQLAGGSGLSVANYWFTEHLSRIDAGAHAAAFARFVRRLELNRGGYVDAQATASHADLRAVGQRNLGRGLAHLWIHNRRHTWHNVLNGGAVPPASGEIGIVLLPNQAYQVERFDTWSGAVLGSEVVTADGAGRLRIQVRDLGRDVALLISPPGVQTPRNLRVRQ